MMIGGPAIPGYSRTFDFMDTFFGILCICIIVTVIGVFILILTRGAREWHSNNQQPVLTVEALLVAKRQDVSHHDGHSTSWHYATFQVESGDRMEFSVTGSEYGLLAEGDHGRLTFQGTRYLGFERT